MKRLSSALLAFCLACGIAAPASANLSAGGVVTMFGQVGDNLTDFQTGDKMDVPFTVNTRWEMFFAFEFSEKLNSRIEMRVPNNGTWGNGNDWSIYMNITNAYINWKPTDMLNIIAGQQEITLPTYMGYANPVFDDHQTGISIDFLLSDTFGVEFDWIRLESLRYPLFASVYSRDISQQSSAYDMFNIVLPVNMGIMELKPWISVAHLGRGVDIETAYADSLIAGSATKGDETVVVYFGDNYLAPVGSEAVERFAFMGGLTTKFNVVENLTFGVDAMYTMSTMSDNNISVSVAGDTTQTFEYDVTYDAGYLVDAYLAYELPMLTIGAHGWYASGDTINMDDDEVTFASIISNNHGWGTGNSLFFANANPLVWTTGVETPAGTMGGGLSISNLKPIEPLTIGIDAMYVMGTHEYISGNKSITQSNVNFLTGEDTIIEIGANATYDIYSDFQAMFVGSYIIPTFGDTDTDNAFVFGAGLKYTF